MNTIAPDPEDALEFSDVAAEQFERLASEDEALAGRLLEQIFRWVVAWSPGDEDGRTIKHVGKLSHRCGWSVYRLKCRPQVGEWRVFFFILNGRTPAVRRIEEIVKYTSQAQCYDDMSQPHLTRIRKSVLALMGSGEINRRGRR